MPDASPLRLASLLHAPQGTIPLPLLAGPALDVWQGSTAPRRGEHQGVHWADDGESLFLQLTIDDAEWQRDPAAASEQAYHRLEAARQQHPGRHWWRLWNYLGGILSGEGDDERYRLFTLGRHRAWAASGQLDAHLPAATAIGCEQGLHIFALAGSTAAQAIENPRQVSAWRYPRAYGLQPPSFARAALVQSAGTGWLFVSGTASIVGHESRHAGDVAAQFAEARANLDAVLAAAADAAGRPASEFVARNFKLYWSDAADAARDARLGAELAAMAPTQVLQGTVCRRELAVEIEALYQLPAGVARATAP